MTSKSRHKRVKQLLPSKKKGRKPTAVFTTAAEKIAAPTVTLAASPSSASSPVAVPKSRPVSATASYPYVPIELKRIGLMAVIMLAVLIILSRVLS